MSLNNLLTKSLLATTDRYISSLNKGGIKTIGDMLEYYPKSHEDRTNILRSYTYINLKEKNTILVKLVNIETTRVGSGKILTKGYIEDENGILAEAAWWNRKYLQTQLAPYKGKEVLISGKVKYDYGKLSFSSPEIETDSSKIKGEIVGVYSDLNYIPGRWIGEKMKKLESYTSLFSDNLPIQIIKEKGFVSKAEAVNLIHFPKNKLDIEKAKKRLAYEELYFMQYEGIKKKYDKLGESEGRAVDIPLNSELIKSLIEKLPFSLTNIQKISLFQILKDMENKYSMSRLLEGDVGTGKTVVAIIASLHSILESAKKGERVQVAFMAPTEILARQHFEGNYNMLFEYGISSDLLVGSTTAKNKEEIKNNLKAGHIDIIFGTHALIEEDVHWKRLGLVIIDEQHRFGVKQREALEKKLGEDNYFPHTLYMTATPIPRTLALTLYGDQDLSVLNEYPKDRKIIHTKVIKTEGEREEVILFIRNELEKGRQVFWISPLVEESEKIDLANAKATYATLVDIFAPYTVGLLHGKMKPKEKEDTMNKFADGEINILSSTSVVEVGINVPNATIMCIEGAERFGLSQLHQFRGRVGRGKHQSYCYLYPTTGQYTDRLRAMEKTNNGFELSEIDLSIRGPGEVYGIRQSGLPDLRVADLKDLSLISEIREDIEKQFKKKD